MDEKRTGPRKGGTRTFNLDGTEVKPASAPVPVPKPKTESVAKAAKKKHKE